MSEHDFRPGDLAWFSVGGASQPARVRIVRVGGVFIEIESIRVPGMKDAVQRSYLQPMSALDRLAEET
jgi:hypothetical protein